MIKSDDPGIHNLATILENQDNIGRMQCDKPVRVSKQLLFPKELANVQEAIIKFSHNEQDECTKIL